MLFYSSRECQWNVVENTVVTTSQCGGNLTATNSVMTGDVQGPAGNTGSF
jgi:hypothetical protein